MPPEAAPPFLTGRWEQAPPLPCTTAPRNLCRKPNAGVHVLAVAREKSRVKTVPGGGAVNHLRDRIDRNRPSPPIGEEPHRGRTILNDNNIGTALGVAPDCFAWLTVAKMGGLILKGRQDHIAERGCLCDH